MASERAIAIVGVGAVLPEAGNVPAFWQNIRAGRDSIRDVPPDRWDPALYYDPDPRAPYKTYSRIGGWVTECEWNPLAWKLPLPPRVTDVMDATQKWAVVAAREALLDYGHPVRPLDHERTAVILGNSMGGDNHLVTGARVLFPEIARELAAAGSFRALSADVRGAVLEELATGVATLIPDITEDTMPGELSNITAGRIAALFDFRGPNFVTDAACASAMAALTAAVEGLESRAFDAVLTGGIDANMSPSSFVKFCKIGALSATGSRPYAAGADGFVMGEGGVVLLLKRLEDAEAAGDRVYAVIRGLGSASDGKGKGITAPNPVGQRLAVQRAWQDAGLRLEPGDLIEGHGTSTKVGDVVEVNSLIEVLNGALPVGSVALGSVKSNIGHLKAAAGAVGMLKAALSLRDRVLPPSINFGAPNPGIDFDHSALRVNTQLREWEKQGIRRVGVSSFGFGGTNFHVVLEEHVPGRLRGRNPRGQVAVQETPGDAGVPRAPLRGAFVAGGADDAAVSRRLRGALEDARLGVLPERAAPRREDLDAAVRVAIDYGDAAELVEGLEKALGALESGDAGRWRALRNRGIYLGRGRAGKIAFLFTGQGSQYVNMLRDLRDADEIVARTFAEADAVMTPALGMPLTQRIFVDAADELLLADAEDALKQTVITQPAVLTVDTALARLFRGWGIEPDMVMGHSLGEYAALVCADAIPFADALKAVSARGAAMAENLGDNGVMAAVFGPVERVQAVLDGVDGYAVIANLNSTKECVVGGATPAMLAAMDALRAAGMRVTQLPVSHAFHTRIVESASAPLMQVLRGLRLEQPRLPVIANVTGEFYPQSGAEAMVEILGRQVGSPVQFVKGLQSLYDAGARVFVEMGPKRVLHGLVEDVLGDRDDVLSLFTNHPRAGDVVSVNRALCGLYAAGAGQGVASPPAAIAAIPAPTPAPAAAPAPAPDTDRIYALGKMFSEVLERGMAMYAGERGAVARPRVGITGAALGLPGRERVFDDAHVASILRGEQFISSVPAALRQAMAGRGIVRLVKGAGGEASFEQIDDPAAVIKLAGRSGALDLVAEYGFPEDRDAALDRVTRIAIAAGLDALRDAGIPLVQRYRTTTTGSRLPIGWSLPEELRDDTGVVFASAFPGYDSFARTLTEFEQARARRERLEELQSLRAHLSDAGARSQLDTRIAALRAELDEHPYQFDRRFLFQVLSMGHSQFAEYIGARGPNVGTNAACASATQAVAIAKDWIETGRCRRVIVITADDITTDALLPWFGSGFLASGAAATDERVEEAALPFDRRRHGLLIGSGGAALVLESLDAAAERAVQPICEILGSVIANSAFHGSRLDVEHIVSVMERLVREVEERWQLDRQALAAETVFVSHETYTPARGGSASAEAFALRRVFGDAAAKIVIANTKGYTGHPMAVGIEDTLAVKMLETGVVPPVANFREIDPELGVLNLSQGGSYPVRYALRLGAGFGSQIAMTLLRWLPPADGARRRPEELGFAYRITDLRQWRAWLARVSGESNADVETVQRTLRVRTGAAVMAPPPVAAPVVAATQPSPPVSLAEPVRERVLAIVAEQTGYPADMLDPDLDMEADLGIDTVKQAEMFAAIRTEYGIERDENLALRDYPTLARAIEFVYEKRPDLRQAGAAPVASTPAVADDAVREAVLRIVAEQTGYPADMLDPDLDMEADLGIDTVKQAEMFAAIRTQFGIERDENLALRDYPTLARAIEFVYEKRPDLRNGSGGAIPAATPAASAPPPLPAATGDDAAALALPRRAPRARVRPPIASFASTGIVLGERDRVVVCADTGGVADALVDRLQQRGVVPLVLEPQLSPDEAEAQVQAWQQEAPIRGVYWLPALDPTDEAVLLEPATRAPVVAARVKSCYRALRALYETFAREGTFLVSGTRLGGRHGYDAAGAADVLGGAIAGLTKSFARERPNALVKVADFAPGSDPALPAEHLLEETLYDPGVVEVGHVDGLRWHVALEASPYDAPVALPSGGTYVITGAAGSIVSAIVADLASATGAEFWLLDLTAAPDASDPDLARLDTDREALKRDIFARLQGTGTRATPALVEKELARLERARAALATIRAVETAGGTALYRSVDLRDAAAVGDVCAEIRARSGRVDVLLHAAGLEISRSLPDKHPDEFDLVFDVKVDGWYNLVRGLGDTPLGAAVAFSSIAGRFGNAGQADYSAANDLLCKAMSALPRTRGARGIAIDWTAWAEIGMAARGSIPAIMKQAGIDMLSPRAGVPVVRLELGSAGREVVIADALGIMLHERAAAGGLRAADSGLVQTVAFDLNDGLSATALLDPAAQPFLYDHAINGTAVLPGVMGIELMAQAARAAWPERVVTAVEQVEFSAPFKFYRSEPRTVAIEVRYAADGEDVIGECTLYGTRQLHGRSEPERAAHFTARVRLGTSPSRPRPPLAIDAGARVEPGAIYGLYFHGPAYQVLGGAWRDGTRMIGELAQPLPPNHSPETAPLLTAPRLIELAFQAAGLGEIADSARMGLPQRIARVLLHQPAPAEASGVRAVAMPGVDGADVVVCDAAGQPLLTVEAYQTATLSAAVDTAPFQALMQEVAAT